MRILLSRINQAAPDIPRRICSTGAEARILQPSCGMFRGSEGDGRKSVKVQDWRNLDYMWRNWKVGQIKADALMWMGRYAEAAVEMKSALYDIQSDDDKREARQEGFYGDLKFLQERLKERFPDLVKTVEDAENQDKT